MAKRSFSNDVPELERYFTKVKNGFVVVIRVKPHVTEERMYLSESGEITLCVKEAAVDGAANGRVIELLAEVCKLPKSHLSIIGGHRARIKKIFIKALHV